MQKADNLHNTKDGTKMKRLSSRGARLRERWAPRGNLEEHWNLVAHNLEGEFLVFDFASEIEQAADS